MATAPVTWTRRRLLSWARDQFGTSIDSAMGVLEGWLEKGRAVQIFGDGSSGWLEVGDDPEPGVIAICWPERTEREIILDAAAAAARFDVDPTAAAPGPAWEWPSDDR